MTDEHDLELDELLGAYAMGALDGDEQALVDNLLARSPAARRELARLEHALVALTDAEAATVLPTGSWDRLVDVLRADPPTAAPGVGGAGAPDAGEPPVLPPLRLPTASRRPAPHARRWARPALAAAAVVLIAGLGTVVVAQQRRLHDRGRAALPTLAADALVDPTSLVGTLDTADGAVHLQAVVDRNGTGYLFADALPALTDGRVYQLWTVDGAAPVSLGILGSRPTLVTFPTGGQARTLAITAEQAPGAVAPTGTPLVVGKVAPRPT